VPRAGKCSGWAGQPGHHSSKCQGLGKTESELRTRVLPSLRPPRMEGLFARWNRQRRSGSPIPTTAQRRIARLPRASKKVFADSWSRGPSPRPSRRIQWALASILSMKHSLAAQSLSMEVVGQREAKACGKTGDRRSRVDHPKNATRANNHHSGQPHQERRQARNRGQAPRRCWVSTRTRGGWRSSGTRPPEGPSDLRGKKVIDARGKSMTP